MKVTCCTNLHLLLLFTLWFYKIDRNILNLLVFIAVAASSLFCSRRSWGLLCWRVWCYYHLVLGFPISSQVRHAMFYRSGGSGLLEWRWFLLSYNVCNSVLSRYNLFTINVLRMFCVTWSALSDVYKTDQSFRLSFFIKVNRTMGIRLLLI